MRVSKLVVRLDVEEVRQLSPVLSLLERGNTLSAFIAFESASTALKVSVRAFFNILKHCLKEGVVKGVLRTDSGVEVFLGFSVEPGLFMPIDTLAMPVLAVHDGALVCDAYTAWLLLDGILLALENRADAGRNVRFDDGAEEWHLLYRGEKYHVVFKYGAGPLVLRVYDSYSDALKDYNTVDYGWEGWSPLQAQKLTVTPLAELRPGRLLTELRVKECDVIPLLSALARKIADEDVDVPALLDLFKEFTELDRELRKLGEEFEKLMDEEKRERDYLLFKAPVRVIPYIPSFKNRKVIARMPDRKIVLFTQPPEPYKEIVLTDYEEHTSRKGKKYVLCRKWIPYSEYRRKVLEKLKAKYEPKYSKLREKKKKIIEKEEQVLEQILNLARM